MVVFVWSGQDAQGQVQTGQISAPHTLQARAMLQQQGIKVRQVQRQPQPQPGRVTANMLALFTRQLATLVRAGVPLLQSLDLVTRSTPQPAWSHLLQSLRQDIENGSTLNAAFRQHPAHFSPLFCSMVAAGEAAGILDDMLDKLALTLEKNAALQSKIRAALTYPAAVVSVAVAVVVLVLLTVVPVFQDVFNAMGATLPLPTQWVIALSQGLLHSAWFFAVLLLGAWLLWRSGWHRQPARRLWLSQRQLRLPLIGAMVQSAVVARWAHTLSALLSAGVPMAEALGPVASACDHAVYAQASEAIRAQVAQGSSLNESMALSGLFPDMVVQLCTIGEETGSVDRMLARAGALLENEVHDQLAALSSLLEPVIMLLLGGVVGMILVALYLPIFKLGQVF
jgi:type IV pilus assembly protein PilC